MEYESREIGHVLESIASPAVAPAGGSVAALAGGFGAALCEMAAIHTVQNDVDAGTATELPMAQEQIAQQRSVLLRLATEDAALVDSLFADASDTPQESTVARAAGVPLAIAESCATVLEESLDIATHVDPRVAPDLHTGLIVTIAAYQAAIRTVEINLEEIEAIEIRDSLAERVADVEETVSRTVKRLDTTTDVDLCVPNPQFPGDPG